MPQIAMGIIERLFPLNAMQCNAECQNPTITKKRSKAFLHCNSYPNGYVAKSTLNVSLVPCLSLVLRLFSLSLLPRFLFFHRSLCSHFLSMFPSTSLFPQEFSHPSPKSKSGLPAFGIQAVFLILFALQTAEPRFYSFCWMGNGYLDHTVGSAKLPASGLNGAMMLFATRPVAFSSSLDIMLC